MADKTETITLLAHPFDRDNNELADKDSRVEAQVAGKDVWKVWTIVPWSDFPNNSLTMPRTSSDKPLIGAYQVELNRGNIKRGKEGSSNDYDYFWNAISWKLLDEQPAISNNNGTKGGGGAVSSADERKDRSVALSYAKDAWCAGKIERAELIELAGQFHDAMVNGFTEEE
jgi:hypothetical protein